ncbi:MAG: phosphatidate cytidylyltransferase [Thermoguttaceae bacterium]|nr:phosphatidate cytidylyltransferase [Thermoguttaceae bacterium]
MDFTFIFFIGVLIVLGIISLTTTILKNQKNSSIDPLRLDKFCSRVNSWWALFVFVAFAWYLSTGFVIFLFGAMSFWAMREFITLIPTRQADHRALFLLFFICVPLQYIFVWLEWYDVYSVAIPSFIFLLIPIIIAMFGDTKFFLTRITQISVSLLICVYSLSFAPALLTLKLPENSSSAKAGLLLFFLLMTQLSELFPFLTKAFFTNPHPIAPNVNTSKTWEGLCFGMFGTFFVGTLASPMTPFPAWADGLSAMLIALMASGGSLTLSAIKRDRGVRDYGTLVVGHGGILDRIDSICFAAPVFFQTSRILLNFHDQLGGTGFNAWF